MRAERDGRRHRVGRWGKLVALAATVALVVPGIGAVAELGDPPPPETHYPAGDGQLEGTELVEFPTPAPPCIRAERTLFGLRGTGTFEGRTPAGDPVVYRAQIGPGQTLYGDGPLQVQLENTETYYHGPFGTHGTEAGGGAGCSPTTAGTPVPAEFRIFAAEGWADTDGDVDVDVLTGAAWVYRLDGTGAKVPCVGQGSFARADEVSSGTWLAEWTLSADCVVVGNQAGTPGTGTAPRGTFLTDRGYHAPCFNPPCTDNLRVDYQQYLPKPGPYLRLSGPDSATVGCEPPVSVTARLTDTGWPVAGVAVSFSVAGPGPAVPPDDSATTDANGEAAFSFTAAVAGDYTVTATATLDGTQVSATHMVRFGDPPPPSVTLASAPNRWQTEEQVSVTATVTAACGPLPGAEVDFAVDWPAQDRPWTGQASPASGSALTGADGRATFSFAGDRAGDYRVTATARLPTGETASATRIVALEIRSLRRVGAITLSEERELRSAVMDPAGAYAYFGTEQGQVVKVDLATFERVGTLTLRRPDGDLASWLHSAVIDPAGRFAYFGATNSVAKIDLASFEQVGTLDLDPDEYFIETAVIDPAGRFAYFGTNSGPGRIVKIDLATFTRVGAIEPRVGDQDLGWPQSAVIDPAGRFVYFGTTDGGSGWVLKVDLASFQITQTLTLPTQEYQPISAVIDPAGDFAYFGTGNTRPGRVVKIDLRTFERVGALTFAPGETLPLNPRQPAVIDPAGNYAYFGAWQGRDATRTLQPAKVVKVDLATFERVHAITLEAGATTGEDTLASAVIDPAGGYAYFGTDSQPPLAGQGPQPPDGVVKVQLRRPPNPALVAGDDAYAATAGSPLTVAAPGVLANDADTADGDPLQAGPASDPAGGIVTLDPDGGFTYTPDAGFAGTDTLTYAATDGMDWSPPATVTLNVAVPAGVTGRAFGYHADNISLFGGAQPDTGPTPTVALAPDGSNSPQSAGAPTGLVAYGPATLFTSDAIDVATAVGPGGDSVAASAAIANVNQAATQPSTGSEVLTAERIEGSCAATATARSGSATITGGTVRTRAQDPDYPDEGLVAVPANPPPNYTVEGYLYLSETSRDDFRIVFNEQVENPDGSLTVNAVHEYFLGPILVGDLVLGQSVCRWGTTTTPAPRAVADFDGDGRSDIGVFRPATGAWFVTGGPTTYHGRDGDAPVAADYDGDGDADVAVWRPATGAWHRPGASTVYLGRDGDLPVPADYDGDGAADIAVFRPTTGGWHRPGQPTVYFGRSGDVAVPADYDGDGDADIAVFRPASGAWLVQGRPTVYLGRSGDVPVPADYDGDGVAEPSVFRPATGAWFRPGAPTVHLGRSGDVPVPADYDGDGSADLAVFRPATGGWYRPGLPTVFFGRSGDVPLPLPAAIYRSMG